MSFLLTLDEDKLEEVVPLLPKYEKHLAAAAPIFNLDGRKLEEILRTVGQYQYEYDRAHLELKALCEWLDNIKEKKVGKLWKKYNEGYSRALAARDIQAYIASEREIVELNQIIIEVTLLKSNAQSVVEAIKQLAWMAGHITKLRVAEIQDAIL